ncbi:hypothetical protein IP70_06850 [alpha proteobacterium AAP38]|uniref:Uncharacterized protein n=1 Tax=Niveispirillum cyanobacteriorum TaxID=1612173 RepID=A0A2K9NAA9_9PROT|nr:hypothetical protein [Niveispirillum cyanobacteriorum]AUN30009.1 hypothetical protein C0V82_07040 [Niveispirillum cyanobacteriorum]KPF86072.1 hypothetical protein IP70_06850 [alpha proteobacterium AAP38]MBJ7415773.1 hypothetical protein [Niveispirillum sp.]GGE58656.1 hypothetical protein GCM10011317_15570 [Niveispirillum cyanobacteriorum]
MPSIQEIIAQSIKDADKSFFNEDYMKQAKSVVDALRKSGLEVVPVKPPEELVTYASENIPLGRLRPTDFIRTMYSTMVANARKFVS